MEKEFINWFEASEKRFAHGQFDEKQIAYSAWLEGKKQAELHSIPRNSLSRFADYILHNANWSESYITKPWYSEALDRNVTSQELAELFLNSQ